LASGGAWRTAVLGSELHSYIDALPERSLFALKPLLINAGLKEYREHPENFISFDDYLT
jgi:hypothetical protein